MKKTFKELFEELTFTDIFETFDDEYLTDMVLNKPEQLNRMCIFLSLDEQIRKENQYKSSKEKIN
jgi:hypothetical protein|tara:strand:- start:1257 stop:1451 length:195 start_codon:yes stop_codon:yes gene_type:complete